AHLPAHREGRPRESELRLAGRGPRRRAAESDLSRAALSARAGAAFGRSARAAAAAGALAGSAGGCARTGSDARVARAGSGRDDAEGSARRTVRLEENTVGRALARQSVHE